jgi:tetratricopeptide (TPR) repeat protein
MACGQSQQETNAQQENQLLSAGLKAQVDGHTAEATDDYKKVLAINPRNKYALYNLGLIEQQAGQNDAAEREYRACLQIDPNFANAMYNLAILRTGPSPEEAVALYRHVIAVEPNWAGAHLNLGFLLISLGQGTEGRSELARALAIDSSLASRVPPGVLSPSIAPAPTPTRRP